MLDFIYRDPQLSWIATMHLRFVGFTSITPCSSKQGTHWCHKGRKKPRFPNSNVHQNKSFE